MVDGGPMLKRWMPKAHGRATPVRNAPHISIWFGLKSPNQLRKRKHHKIILYTMGHKVHQNSSHPIHFAWDSKWFAKNDQYSNVLEQEIKIRDFWLKN